MRIAFLPACLCLAFCIGTTAAQTVSGVPQAITPSLLQAMRQDRQRFVAERRPVPDLWVFEDFPAALHIPLDTSETAAATRDQALAAAQKTGLRVLMFAGRNISTERWSGLTNGVLILTGAEDTNGHLQMPKSANNQKSLAFLVYGKRETDIDPSDYTGIEIGSLSGSQIPDSAFGTFWKNAATSSESWQNALELFKRYPDEMAALAGAHSVNTFTQWDRFSEKHPFTGIAASQPFSGKEFKAVSIDPFTASFRHLTTHILARELSETAVRQALAEGHAYVSHDWLCDPTGFAFGAHNNLGTFPMGDRALLWEKTQVTGFTPLAAKLKLFRNGTLVHETYGTNFSFSAKSPGAFRLEAWLTIGGVELPWIYSNPVYLEKPGWAALPWPTMDLSAPVEVTNNLTYVEGKPEDVNKHKLDLYLPKERKSAPVFIFFHGGAWRTGDRALYPAVGYRFAKEGIITVVPSYRLGPKNKHPAQVEDAASAFAWTIQNIAAFGGDTNRIYVGGHSAGGHMAALLALDEHVLAGHKLSPKNIRGVISLSGVFDLDIGDSQAGVFGKDPVFRKNASPINHVTSSAPPFLVTYCQWDYVPLGAQAKRFSDALRRAGVPVTLHFTPHENHISEVIALTHDDDATAKALLQFLK